MEITAILVPPNRHSARVFPNAFPEKKERIPTGQVTEHIPSLTDDSSLGFQIEVGFAKWRSDKVLVGLDGRSCFPFRGFAVGGEAFLLQPASSPRDGSLFVQYTLSNGHNIWKL